VNREPPDAPYTLRQVQDMLGLGRSAVAGLIEAGVVTPARGRRNEFRFSFQDVVLLRTAAHLRAAQVPPRRLHRSLKLLKARLPANMPLSGLRIQAIGSQVAVRAADARWESDGGQLLLDWEVSTEPQGAVRFLDRSLPGIGHTTTTAAKDAAGWFRQGEVLELQDRVAAEQAYKAALAIDPAHADACLNLGALWCEAGRCAEAVQLYSEAIARMPGEPLLHFNLAIALEDLHREAEALAAYEDCLALAPALADAHYNAARLHDKLGHPQAALRHYSSYRRLRQT
jgi:tetratricopeptide (TPR) repeat protein